MICSADLIAVVDIERVSLDTTSSEGPSGVWNVHGNIVEKVKGDSSTSLDFIAPTFSPCAPVELQPGRYLVFLYHDGTHYKGLNWYFSYLKVNGSMLKWFDGEDPKRMNLVDQPLTSVIGKINATNSNNGLCAEKMKSPLIKFYTVSKRTDEREVISDSVSCAKEGTIVCNGNACRGDNKH